MNILDIMILFIGFSLAGLLCLHTFDMSAFYEKTMKIALIGCIIIKKECHHEFCHTNCRG